MSGPGLRTLSRWLVKLFPPTLSTPKLICLSQPAQIGGHSCPGLGGVRDWGGEGRERGKDKYRERDALSYVYSSLGFIS